MGRAQWRRLRRAEKYRVVAHDPLTDRCPPSAPRITPSQSIPCAGPDGATMDKAAMAAAYPPAGVNGIKLESFIFDVFPAARRMAVLQVDRDAEFSPVKNAPGSADDSPDTARALMSALHSGWVRAAGATVEGEGVVEVSGGASYAGEGLGALSGVALRAPVLVKRAGEACGRPGANVFEIA